MQTVLTSVSDERARVELKRFALLSLPLPIIGLFVFGILGTAGVMFGGRALLLSFHKGNRSEPLLWLYRLMALAAFVVGWMDVIIFFAKAK